MGNGIVRTASMNEMNAMSDSSNRTLSFVCFLLGVMLPLAGLALWSRSGSRKEEIDKAHDVTVEDSFPASDPPSAW
jgi:hypothetical protein